VAEKFTEAPPTCPHCGSKGPFLVECAEWVLYHWDSSESDPWQSGHSHENYPVDDLQYRVTCERGHHFDAEPWE